MNRFASVLFALGFLGLQCMPGMALAENTMGYKALSQRQASAMPQRGGKLGIDVGPGQQISDGGLTFELLQVRGVQPNSPGAQAGLKQGDQLIAADGYVFESVAAFAAYVASTPPGQSMSVDVMPAGGGPQQAERISIVSGGEGTPQRDGKQKEASGMSTGTKVAIGAGAAALFGCYAMGCFSSKPANGAAPQ